MWLRQLDAKGSVTLIRSNTGTSPRSRSGMIDKIHYNTRNRDEIGVQFMMKSDVKTGEKRGSKSDEKRRKNPRKMTQNPVLKIVEIYQKTANF